MENNERQEIHCHDCGQYVQFDIDVSMNGNHVLNCPVCGHEHCRVVKDGIITEDRWDSRNGSSIMINTSTMSVTSTSTWDTYTTTASTGTTGATTADTYYLYDAWLNRSG